MIIPNGKCLNDYTGDSEKQDRPKDSGVRKFVHSIDAVVRLWVLIGITLIAMS